MTRLEAAAERGNDIGAVSYGSIKSILQNGLDKAYCAQTTAPSRAASGGRRRPDPARNIRGRGYYH